MLFQTNQENHFKFEREGLQIFREGDVFCIYFPKPVPHTR